MIHRLPIPLGFAIAGALLLSAPAVAENNYEAKPVSWSPADVVKVEGNQKVPVTIVAKNVGTRAWTNTGTFIRPTSPHEHASLFGNATWLAGNNAAALTEAKVPPDGKGTFTFLARAPDDGGTETKNYKDFFAPWAQASGNNPGGWMDGTDKWPAEAVPIIMRVQPRKAPVVTVTSAVAGPDSVTIRADASDNIGVSEVAFSVSGRNTVVDTAAPYEAVVPLTGVRGGTKQAVATAVDFAETKGSDSEPVTIVGYPNGNPAGQAQLALKLPKHAAFGKPTAVTGTLVNASGQPIAGAALEVSQKVRRPYSGRTDLMPVTTDAAGKFALTLPAGPSRTIRVGYRAFTLDRELAAEVNEPLLVRAHPRISIDRKRLNSPGKVKVTGKLRGGRIPSKGVVVVVQAKQVGTGWFRCGRARAHGSGAFKTPCAFRQVPRTTQFQVRAFVRHQRGYPYAPGLSKTRRITVTR